VSVHLLQMLLILWIVIGESFVVVNSINSDWLDNEFGNVPVSDSDDNSSENINSVDVVEQLRRWAVAASIKQDALSVAMMSILDFMLVMICGQYWTFTSN